MPLLEEERQALHTMIRAHTTPQHLRCRAQMILLLADGLPAPASARRLGTTRTTVRRWRRRWLKRPGWAVHERLQDTPRPGAPTTCSVEPWCQTIALAGEPAEASGRPLSPWTPRARMDEARHRGLVATISARHVGRFFPSGRTKAALGSMLSRMRPPRQPWPT